MSYPTVQYKLRDMDYQYCLETRLAFYDEIGNVLYPIRNYAKRSVANLLLCNNAFKYLGHTPIGQAMVLAEKLAQINSIKLVYMEKDKKSLVRPIVGVIDNESKKDSLFSEADAIKTFLKRLNTLWYSLESYEIHGLDIRLTINVVEYDGVKIDVIIKDDGDGEIWLIPYVELEDGTRVRITDESTKKANATEYYWCIPISTESLMTKVIDTAMNRLSQSIIVFMEKMAALETSDVVFKHRTCRAVLKDELTDTYAAVFRIPEGTRNGLEILEEISDKFLEHTPEQEYVLSRFVHALYGKRVKQEETDYAEEIQ